MSDIPEYILNKIREAKDKQLKELDLSINKWWDLDKQELTQIIAEVFELAQLEVLNLSGNKLTAVPDAITQLSNLTSLNLSYNQLTTFPDRDSLELCACLKHIGGEGQSGPGA